jgi:hypothetical protein
VLLVEFLNHRAFGLDLLDADRAHGEGDDGHDHESAHDLHKQVLVLEQLEHSYRYPSHRNGPDIFVG